uniref:Uncharacterized protein n=1 Tax=Melanopsichium pennsylvanicum 4 TaxID=1398559 RepID=A0A077QUX1_9BASI|nr:uncharacterized protein BN887_02541 [Melanopsichium pennsylvanicum 4]
MATIHPTGRQGLRNRVNPNQPTDRSDSPRSDLTETAGDKDHQVKNNISRSQSAEKVLGRTPDGTVNACGQIVGGSGAAA